MGDGVGASRGQSASIGRMKRNRIWIATTGGPHLLIAAEQLRHWRGIQQETDDPSGQSDYSRTCRATTWLGSIACNEGHAVVLSGDAGDIAWYPSGRGDEGFLVQWLGVDDERLIESALRAPELRHLLESSNAERLEFETGVSGAMWLIDASDRGSDLQSEHQVLALQQGNYLARAAHYQSAGLSIVVREICRIGVPSAGAAAQD